MLRSQVNGIKEYYTFVTFVNNWEIDCRRCEKKQGWIQDVQNDSG